MLILNKVGCFHHDMLPGSFIQGKLIMPSNKNHSDQIISDSQRQSIEALYQEGIRMHLYSVEWRHKIMLRFFISSAALLIAAGWLWERKNVGLQIFLFLPFLIAAIMSVGYFLIDRRIVSQINLSYKTGIRLEKAIFEKGGHFADIVEAGRDRAGKLNNRLSIVSYTFVLEFFYLSTSLILFILVAIIFLRYSM